MVLEARDLRKSYGSINALKGVDVEVGEGELVGLLGPNGAGKSTLVKIACGLVRPSGGWARIAGAPPARRRRTASWALPFEALYQSALSAITVDTFGFTRLAIDLGPFGGPSRSARCCGRGR